MQVTLIDVLKSASYSGMVPGCIARTYTPEQTLLDLQPLTDWADIEFIIDQVVDIDCESKIIQLKNDDNDNPTTSRSIPFDVLSIDIGSASRGLKETPGTAEFTIPTRPIHKLVKRITLKEKELLEKNQKDVRVVVIGGGAAGIELSLSITGRWSNTFPNVQLTLLDAGTELLPNENPKCRAALLDLCS